MTTLVGVRRALAGAPSILSSPAFAAPFKDLGSGQVDTTALGFPGTAATFTRATSATCWSSAGLLLTVLSGVPRSTYTELTGTTYLGYLAEEARTNNVIQNRDFTNAAWVKTTCTAAKDQVGIDGSAAAASSLLAIAGNALAAQTIVIAAVNRPFSVYIKRLTGTGNIDLAQDGVSFTTQTIANDGLYHRCTLVASQLNPVLTIRIVTNADKIAVDYAGLEDTGGSAAAFPTSPIATTAVAVTRNADVLTYPSAGNWNTGAGTVYAEVNCPLNTAIARVVADAGSASFALNKNSSAAPTTILTNDGTTSAITAATTSAVNVEKWAATWSGAIETIYLNGGGAITAAFDGSMNMGANIAVGGIAGANSLNGTIRAIKIWTSALTPAQVALL